MELHAQVRTILGKKSKRLRREGLIPAELYGHGIRNLHLSVKEKEFEKIYASAGEHTIINLLTEDSEKVPVLITETVKNPISQKYLNINFHQIRMDEEITAKIPIEFIGEAPALKKDFVLVKALNEIEIKSLPQNLPRSIKVNLEGLTEAHQNISVKNLNFPSKIKVLVPKDTIIVTVIEKAREEIPESSAPVLEPETKTPAEETPPQENK